MTRVSPGGKLLGQAPSAEVLEEFRKLPASERRRPGIPCTREAPRRVASHPGNADGIQREGPSRQDPSFTPTATPPARPPHLLASRNDSNLPGDPMRTPVKQLTRSLVLRPSAGCDVSIGGPSVRTGAPARTLINPSGGPGITQNLLRRVGPTQVARITLVTAVDQTAARNAQADVQTDRAREGGRIARPRSRYRRAVS